MFTIMPFTIAALERFQGFCVEIFTCVRYQTYCQQDEEIGANIKKMGRWNVLFEIPKLSIKALYMPVLLFSNFIIIFLRKEPV